MYKIIFSKTVLKRLEKLSVEERQHILNVLQRARIRPEKFIRKVMTLEDTYKLRVGDYRVLAIIVRRNRTILVERIAHRRNTYKKLKQS